MAMNALKKKAALKKIEGMSPEDAKAHLQLDGGYSEDEITEILGGTNTAATTAQPAPTSPNHEFLDRLAQFNYNGIIEGEQFKALNQLNDELLMEQKYTFEVYRVLSIKKPRYEGIPDTPNDIVGIRILDSTPIKTTTIPAKMMREFNGYIPKHMYGKNFFTIEGGHWSNLGNNPAAAGHYYLLKKG